MPFDRLRVSGTLNGYAAHVVLQACPELAEGLTTSSKEIRSHSELLASAQDELREKSIAYALDPFVASRPRVIGAT